MGLQSQAALAINVMEQADTVLGLAMGAFSLKTLLPKSMSIMAGLPAGLQNVKTMLIDQCLPGYMLILVTACVLPVYAGYLATLQQILGDEKLLPALLLVLLHIALGLYWGHRLAHNMDVPTMKRTFHLETAANIIVLGAASAFVIWWVLQS